MFFVLDRLCFYDFESLYLMLLIVDLLFIQHINLMNETTYCLLQKQTGFKVLLGLKHTKENECLLFVQSIAIEDIGG
jgi:hypothetical protein